MNRKYETVVKEKIDKLLNVGFIYQIEHTEWVLPIVIVMKKNGKSSIYVDLKKVNATTIRDHYPLPFMEHVFEIVVGHEAYGVLDGFSRYNQVSIDPYDQHKNSFCHYMGSVCVSKDAIWLYQHPSYIPMINEYSLLGVSRIWLDIFLDNLCIYSRWLEHLKYLKMVFDRCWLYKISLNPIKC